jgi:hypothetical protein
VSQITGIEGELGEGRTRRPCGQVCTTPRMGFTEEPTRAWEVGEPVPLEIPEPGHERAVPELDPTGS